MHNSPINCEQQLEQWGLSTGKFTYRYETAHYCTWKLDIPFFNFKEEITVGPAPKKKGAHKMAVEAMRPYIESKLQPQIVMKHQKSMESRQWWSKSDFKQVGVAIINGSKLQWLGISSSNEVHDSQSWVQQYVIDPKVTDLVIDTESHDGQICLVQIFVLSPGRQRRLFACSYVSQSGKTDPYTLEGVVLLSRPNGLPSNLLPVLGDPAITKWIVGNGDNEAEDLRKSGIEIKGIRSLNLKAEQLGYNRECSLLNLTKYLLGVRFDKDEAITRSDWSQTLNKEQIDYAVMDVVVPQMILEYYKEMRWISSLSINQQD